MKYATLNDVRDSSIRVLEEDLEEADRVIDSYLLSIDVDPASVQLPNPILNTIAVKYACYTACIREAMGDNTIYIEKAKQYKQQYEDLIGKLSPATFSEVQNSISIATIRLFRG